MTVRYKYPFAFTICHLYLPSLLNVMLTRETVLDLESEPLEDQPRVYIDIAVMKFRRRESISICLFDVSVE